MQDKPGASCSDRKEGSTQTKNTTHNDRGMSKEQRNLFQRGPSGQS